MRLPRRRGRRELAHPPARLPSDPLLPRRQRHRDLARARGHQAPRARGDARERREGHGDGDAGLAHARRAAQRRRPPPHVRLGPQARVMGYLLRPRRGEGVPAGALRREEQVAAQPHRVLRRVRDLPPPALYPP